MSDDQTLLNLSQDASADLGISDRHIAPTHQERPDWARHLGVGEDDDLTLDDLMKLVPLDLH
jgi:hypothetical protein